MTPPAPISVPTAAGRRRALVEVRAGVAFLTRVPVGPADPASTGASAFGLVGAAIGVVGALPLLVLAGTAPLAASALAVGAIAVVSGALPLDGLADTADALAAPNLEASARARKDPAVGPAGAVAIAIVVLVDAGLLAALAAGPGPAVAALACIVAATGSRVVPVLVVALPVGQPAGQGLGAWFAARTGRTSALVAVGSAIAVALLAMAVAARPALFGGAVGGVALVTVVAGGLARARGSLDGDGLGALVEVAFAAILLMTVLVS